MEALLYPLLFLVLPALIGGVLYAGALLAARRVASSEHWRINGILAVCWIIALSGALWLWFEAVEAQAAAVHAQNIGIPLIFGWIWTTMVIPAPMIGSLIVRWLTPER